MLRTLVGLAIALIVSCPVAASGPEDGLFNAAKTMIASVQSSPNDDKLETYRSAKNLLDVIAKSYGDSEKGQAILAEEVVDGIDIGALNTAIRAGSFDGSRPVLVDLGDTLVLAPPEGKTGSAEMEPTSRPIDQQSLSAAERPTVDQTEKKPTDIGEFAPVEQQVAEDQFALMAPDGIVDPTSEVEGPLVPRAEKDIVRDVQSELNRLGCDAGTADGIAGRNTLTAFRDFIAATESDLGEENLATEEAVVELRAHSGVVCTPRKAPRTSPSQLAGSWGWRTDCPGFGRTVRNRGGMNLRHVGGGRLEGPARNTQGNRGTGVIQINGSRASSYVSYGFAKIRSNMQRTSTSPVTFSGKGTNNCLVVMWKR